MYQFFTEEFAGLPAETLNWIALAACVLGVLLVVYIIFKLFRGATLGGSRRGRHARLAVTDATSIGDDRRKLVLVRRDNVEHLLLIGGSNDLVIESDIVRTAPQQTRTRASTATPTVANTTPAQPSTPAPSVAKLAEAPTQTTTPEPAAVVATPAPAQTSTPAAPAATPVAPIIAATAATGAVIAPALTLGKTAEANVAATVTPPAAEKIEVKASPAVESAPEVNIESATTPTTETSALEAAKPMNSVEEMDALLNEITTEK